MTCSSQSIMEEGSRGLRCSRGFRGSGRWASCGRRGWRRLWHRGGAPRIGAEALREILRLVASIPAHPRAFNFDRLCFFNRVIGRILKIVERACDCARLSCAGVSDHELKHSVFGLCGARGDHDNRKVRVNGIQ